MSDTEFPQQFTHSVKVEETAKGVRISVHVYSNSGLETAVDALALYGFTKDKCKDLNITMAPMEVVEK